MLVHSGERPYKCTVCGQSFTTNGNMHRWVRRARAGLHPSPPLGTCMGGCAARGQAFTLHHHREHARVGAGSLHPPPRARSRVDRKQGSPLAVLPKGRRRSVLCRKAGAGSVCLPAQSPVCQRCLLTMASNTWAWSVADGGLLRVTLGQSEFLC